MRIALTGHTSGIGKAVVQQCRNGNDAIIFGYLIYFFICKYIYHGGKYTYEST